MLYYSLYNNTGTTMTDTVEILDAICGSGKSRHIFNMINDNPQNKYIYVTPLLSEVHERVPKEVTTTTFSQPEITEDGTKSDNLLELIRVGSNISCTHSLFRKMSKLHLDYIRKQEYTVIIDEEVNLIDSNLGIVTKGDIEFAFAKKFIVADEQELGKLSWVEEDLDGIQNKESCVFRRLKEMCDVGILFACKSKQTILTIHLPIELISSAKRVILCTYMFDGSVLDGFLALKGINRTPYNGFTPCNVTAKQQLRGLINIINYPKQRLLEKIGFSKSWYENATAAERKLVANAIRWAASGRCDQDEFMFTTPKSFVCKPNGNVNTKIVGITSTIKGKSTPETSWVFCTARATNDFVNKRVLCHAYNRYPTTPIEIYLRDYGFNIKRDKYAVSEMVQWVFRSRIRNGEPIDLCILSKRMKQLFIEWLESDE